jgi:hypothetical protein
VCFRGNSGYANALNGTLYALPRVFFLAYVYVVKLDFFLRLHVHVQNPCHANVPEKLPHKPGAVYFFPTLAELPCLH